MPQTLLEMTKDLVLAQIHTQHLPPESMQAALHSTYETLCHLETAASPGENGHGNGTSPGLERRTAVDWKGSITRHAIRCLECGETFKQLSLRHLSTHDLDPRAYRARYGIPRSQSLSAREVTARRRELAQQIRPWELAASKLKPASKAAATPKAEGQTAKTTKTTTPRARAKTPASRAKSKPTTAKS